MSDHKFYYEFALTSPDCFELTLTSYINSSMIQQIYSKVISKYKDKELPINIEQERIEIPENMHNIVRTHLSTTLKKIFRELASDNMNVIRSVIKKAFIKKIEEKKLWLLYIELEGDVHDGRNKYAK